MDSILTRMTMRSFYKRKNSQANTRNAIVKNKASNCKINPIIKLNIAKFMIMSFYKITLQ